MKLLLALAGIAIMEVAHAQVATYPYSQDFEEPFLTGHNVAFLPNWWGNYMAQDTMGQYNAFAHSGSHSLFMLPEGEEFKTIVQVRLDLSDAANTFSEIWVASRKNGAAEDEKRVKLNAAVSVNGGITFPYVTSFGPHEGFANANTEFQKFVFAFPPATNNKSEVVLRFIGRSGGGPHLPAMLLIDDILVAQAETDTFPPYIMGNELPISGTGFLKIPFSEPIHPESAWATSNYKFTWPVEEDGTLVVGEGPLPQVKGISMSSDGYSLTLALDPPLSIGETYTLEIRNMEDLNDNVADVLTVDKVVFNEPSPGSLVFTEVLFADPSSLYPKEKLQYVELYNPTDKIVPLGGLRIKGSIAAHDLPNVKLPPGGYWIATRNATSYSATFGKQAWEWKGSWIEYAAEPGEELEPQSLYIQTTNRHGGKLVDSISIDFNDPAWAKLNRPGYSIELCDPFSNHSSPLNWSLANDTEPYYYMVNGVEYKLYATPCSGCEPANIQKYYCTYGQGFYGKVQNNGCSTNGVGSTSLQIMQSVLPPDRQQVFGLSATNRYFVLKGSDLSSRAILNMLPGGKAGAPLHPGGSTYSNLATWSRVPLGRSKNSYGKIENGLLSQAITLYFNMGWNSRKIDQEKFTLSTVRLSPSMTAFNSFDCRFAVDTASQSRSAAFSEKLLDYLDTNYESGATVGNLFDLSNRILGADPMLVRFDARGKARYMHVTATEVSSAIDAINNLFDGCRIYYQQETDDALFGTIAQQEAISVEIETTKNSNDVIAVSYPNPFRDYITIEFSAPVDTWAVLKIHTWDRSSIETLYEGVLKANELKRVNFTPKGKRGGLYMYSLRAGGAIKVGRVLSIR